MMTASVLGVFLTVLKIIGYILAGIIGLALLIVLAVLFVPVRYKVKLKADLEDENVVYGIARASWVLHIVNFSVVLEGTNIVTRIRVFGITVKKMINAEEEPESSNEQSSSLKVLDVEIPDDKPITDNQIETQSLDVQKERKLIIEPLRSRKIDGEPAEILELDSVYQQNNTEILEEIIEEIETDKTKPVEEKVNEAVGEDIVKKNFIGKIKNNIKEKIQEIVEFFKDIIHLIKEVPKVIEYATSKARKGMKLSYDKLNEIEDFINDKENRRAFKFAKKELCFLLKHIMPTKITGSVDFGFDDPATTGRALGLYYSIFPVSPKTFKLTGNFDNECLKGDMMMRGHIRLNHLLMSFFRIKKNKRLVEIIKKFTS